MAPMGRTAPGKIICEIMSLSSSKPAPQNALDGIKCL